MAVTRDALPTPPALQARIGARGSRHVARPSVPSDTWYVVRRTIAQPVDGSDFFVEHPRGLSGEYTVTGHSVKGTTIPFVTCPDDDTTDRTSAHFRVVLSTEPVTGDVFEFLVYVKEV